MNRACCQVPFPVDDGAGVPDLRRDVPAGLPIEVVLGFVVRAGVVRDEVVRDEVVRAAEVRVAEVRVADPPVTRLAVAVFAIFDALRDWVRAAAGEADGFARRRRLFRRGVGTNALNTADGSRALRLRGTSGAPSRVDRRSG